MLVEQLITKQQEQVLRNLNTVLKMEGEINKELKEINSKMEQMLKNWEEEKDEDTTVGKL